MADRVSHDQNFKNLILDYPREALAFFAPTKALAAEDTVEIIPVRQEQLQQQLGGRYRELDVPLLVKWQDEQREDMLFVLEEETDERRFSAPRLMNYCADLAGLYPMTRVVPVVIFLRGAEAAPSQPAVATEHDKYLPFEYQTCRLSAMPFEQWQDSDNLVARLNLPNMQYAAEQKVEVYAKALNGLRTLEPDWDKQSKYIDFIDIYAGLTDNELQRFQQQHPEASETMTGIVQRAREEGMQQGIEEGRVQGIEQGIERGRVQGIEQGIERGRVQGIEQGIVRGREQGIEQGLEQGKVQGIEQGLEQGRVEGERMVLQRQLQHRFGQLPPEIVTRLAQASRSDLETWADGVLNAGTLDDVFGPS